MGITKPNPYIPSFLRAALSGSRPLQLTWSDVSDTNIASTSSFIYDPQPVGLKSTQQLNVDFSKFENHTFFMSAEAKVNLAFDAIINGYPFDGTRQETEIFFEKLSGFEKYVFDNFPRYRGALHFVGHSGGNSVTERGTFIEVQNKTGALFPELSKLSTSAPVLNPTGSQSLTVEMQLFLPTQGNSNEVICQMLSGTSQGFSIMLLNNPSTSSCIAQFTVLSGTSHMSVPVTLRKGLYNHIAFTLNRENIVPYLESYHDGNRAGESRTQVTFGDFDIDGSSLLIGSGSTIQYGGLTLTPESTLSGTIDEFRIFHSVRTQKQLAASSRKNIFATSPLKLYYRFNEPPPPLGADPINRIVLDSSGNSLHALISNFTSSLRINVANDPLSPLRYEHPDTTVVLFPSYPSTIDFNHRLLITASVYDAENPNLITKLIPQHYLLHGAAAEGYNEPEGDAGNPYSGDSIPGTGKMGNVQIMVSLLYIWARFFDDMKLFVDSFSTLRTVDYASQETIPDNFLLDLVKSYGFHLPPLFNDSTIEQYIRGENVDLDQISSSQFTLRHVQNMLLRRVLVNLPDVLKSKGTQHSIKAFLRSVGIDPGNNVRIREYGGPTSQQLSYSRETKIEPGSMVKFSSGSFVTSPRLRSPRIEPGFPGRTGNAANDSLLTSGSWTWEGIVKYTPVDIRLMNSSTQSLVRLCGSGTLPSAVNDGACFANLLTVSSSIDPRITLYLRPGNSPNSPLHKLQLSLPRGGLFNHDKWNVSFGCRRGDDGGTTLSSSYFLRVGYQNAGQIEYLRSTSSFFLETPGGESNVFRSLSTGTNDLGPVIIMGPGQPILTGVGNQYLHLGNVSSVPDEARETDFVGRISNVRFWSKYVEDDEWQEHVRNYNSVGVKDPLVNWNYVTNRTGSFGRLRLNSFLRQDLRRAESTGSNGPIGSIIFPDYSENNLHLTGSNFPIEEDIVVGDVFDLSYLSPYFDEASSDEKIRIRSFQNQSLVDRTPWASTAPLYEIVASERPTDDVRFTIEFSLVDALNRDIITMFATLDAIDNAIGAPELLFSPDYPDLEKLRNIYFNRIKEKLNFAAFFQFYRWFDTSIGTFINQLVPRKTKFKGTNFTVESHMLERAKQEYHFNEIYLGDSNRQNLNSVLLLQQIAGRLRKY